MGSDISNWADASGPIYMGANSSWEVIWVLAVIACLVVSLVIDSKHELDAYKKADSDT